MATKSWKFAETSHKTTVGLNKTDVKFQKELESLERQKNTSMNNIANHQQAMKMSWKRLEERRAESPTLSQRREKKEEQKNNKKGLLFQTNTKLYVDKTPSIYHPETGTSDDDAFTRFRSNSTMPSHDYRSGPPPTSMNEFRTSPYVSSPYNFRKADLLTSEGMGRHRSYSASNLTQLGGNDTELSGKSSAVDLQASSSQVTMIKRTDTNKKAALLKVSAQLNMSSGPDQFKSFYGSRPASRANGAMSSLGIARTADGDSEEEEEEKEEEKTKEKTPMSLAEMFDEIRNCRYIRHYYRDGTTMDEYID